MIEKVLVTGGAGFIGSYTVDLLLQKGYKVRVLDALMPPVHLEPVRPAYLPSDVELMVGDVRDKQAVNDALHGVDAVFHLAAYQDYLPDFSKFFHVNSVGTAMIYEVIVEKKLPIQKIVFASSQATYGEGRYNCEQHGGQYPELRPVEQLMRSEWEVKCPVCGEVMQPQLTDESQIKPHNQYAMSKYTQELIGINLGKRYNIPSVGMRYSITQGPRQSFSNAYSGICRIFTTRMLTGKAPVAYEDGGQLRDYVYVGDVARANVQVMEDARANYQVFNVGGGQAVTVKGFGKLVAEAVGVDLTPEVPGEFRFGDTRHIISDITKLKKLGWSPEVALPEIIRRYIDWAVTQPGVGDYYSSAEMVMKKMGTVRSVSI
ncbi:MAG: NAD-dependent epimerase/dehydratase family protein [Chloroflexi bacterium]|nr:NAD-dependent epimerase/dehydratase family protein [Chloroflexota bacterium]